MTTPTQSGTIPSDNSYAWHLRRTMHLALPIIVARASFLIMAVVDSLMTGWSGSAELAYLGLGLSSQLVMMMIGIGAIHAVSILIAQSVGARDLSACGSVFRTGLVHGGFYGLIIMTASVFAEPFFLATGQQTDIASGAGAVALQFSWGMPALLMFVASNYMLEATDRPKIGMVIMIIVNLLNVPLNAIFAVGWLGWVEPLGAVGAVATSSALRWFALIAVGLYIWHDLRKNGDSFGIIAPNPVRTALSEAVGSTGRLMAWIGLPMGLAQGVESAAFASVTFIAGYLGTVGLATHHITMTLASLMYMMAIGMMSATTIRVGNAVGRGDQIGVARAGWSGIGLGAAVTLIPTIAFLSIPGPIASMFTDDPEVLALASTTIRIAGVLLVFDAMMGVSIGALRGTGDVWPAFYFQAAAFWLLAIPVAWYLVIKVETGPAGLILGILAGVLASLSMMAPRFHIISRRPISRI